MNETDLEVDVLERELREHPAAYIHTGPGYRTLSIEPVRALIQRLRKAEARIAQLEQVREIGAEVVMNAGWDRTRYMVKPDRLDRLRVALADVAEPVKP